MGWVSKKNICYKNKRVRRSEREKHCWGEGVFLSVVYFVVKPWGCRYKGHWVQTKAAVKRWWWGRKKCARPGLSAGRTVHSQSAGTVQWAQNDIVCTLLSFTPSSVTLSFSSSSIPAQILSLEHFSHVFWKILETTLFETFPLDTVLNSVSGAIFQRGSMRVLTLLP